MYGLPDHRRGARALRFTDRGAKSICPDHCLLPIWRRCFQPCSSRIPDSRSFAYLCSVVLEENLMTVPNVPQNSSPAPTPIHRFDNFPVGGADPDFVSEPRHKSALCSIPVLGKMLPQCR